MLPIRRDLHFSIDPARVCDWHGRGRIVTHFMNALSLFFPDGERFFIHSVRYYRERLADPELRDAVAAFIGQEAMHGREHTAYNGAMAAAGLPAAPLQRRVAALLEQLKVILPAPTQLGITIALEHLTAIMANALLAHPDLIEGSDPNYSALWRWHALEETEHKAVAFDVYERTVGTGATAYAVRASSLVVASTIFAALVFAYHLRLVAADPKARKVRDGLRMVGFLHGRKGLLRRIAGPWLDYFRPGFHPWQHDNRALLDEIDAFTARIEREMLTAA